MGVGRVLARLQFWKIKSQNADISKVKFPRNSVCRGEMAEEQKTNSRRGVSFYCTSAPLHIMPYLLSKMSFVINKLNDFMNQIHCITESFPEC